MNGSRKVPTNITQSMKRKTTFILVLAFGLVVGWVSIITDEKVREHLGSTLYIIGFAICGALLLMLAGYVWDQTLAKSLKSLHDTTDSVRIEDAPLLGDESDSDEIIGLARKIERMARSLQQVEASYKGIVEDQPDLICRYRNDGKITFVNGAYARAVNRKRTELVGVDFPYFTPGAAIADEPYTFETEMPFDDGRRLWIRWTQRAIKDDGPRPWRRWPARTRIARLRGESAEVPAHLATGIDGEDGTFFYLRRKGYIVVALARRSPGDQPGDIDLIAWQGPMLCFIEVKTRTAHDASPAEIAVDAHKRNILRRLAITFASCRRKPAPPVRFDVVSV